MFFRAIPWFPSIPPWFAPTAKGPAFLNYSDSDENPGMKATKILLFLKQSVQKLAMARAMLNKTVHKAAKRHPEIDS